VRRAIQSIVIATAILLPASVSAQWLHYPTPGIPRTADGKPDLAAPAPRTAAGKPDLSGIWRISGGFKYLLDLAADGIQVPFQPWAEKLYNERKANNGRDDPEARCLPQGIPKMTYLPYPQKFINAPGMLVILYEANNLFRQVFMDGRELPKDPNPTWLGYSVGHWDQDTLVIDSNGFSDRMWFDTQGHPHTDALHVTERFQRRDLGHIDLEVTIDDPGAYTRPWTVGLKMQLAADTELLEFVCIDRDAQHFFDK
jgi:hypothetical protein